MDAASHGGFAVISATASYTGSTLFAVELVQALADEGADAVLATEMPRGRAGVRNSLGTPWVDRAPPWAAIVHESAWWISCRPDVLSELRAVPQIFCVDPRAARLIEVALGRACALVPVRAEPFEHLYSPGSSLRVLGIGTVSLTKGTDLWLEVIDQHRRRRPVEAAWIGLMPDTRFAAEMSADVERRGLEEVVRWVGLKSSVAAWYEWADVLLLTSRSESHARVLDEARSAGLSTLAFACAVPEGRGQELGLEMVTGFGSEPMAQKLRSLAPHAPHRSTLMQLDAAELARNLLKLAERIC